MTTDIQVYQPGGALADVAATYQGLAAAGMIGFSITDFAPPKIRIVNGMAQVTDWKAQPGQFHNTATGENLDRIEGFLLAMGKGQIWSLPYTEAEKLRATGQDVPVFCRSADGVKPDADFKTPPASACAVCPKAKPTKKEGGGWNAPECANSVKALVAWWNEAEQGYDVAIFLVGKTGTKPLVEGAKQIVMRKKCLWGAGVTITTTQVEGNGNKWFVPHVAVDFTKEIPVEHRALIQELMTLWVPILARTDAAEVHEEEASSGQDAGGAIDTTATPVKAPPPPPPQPEVNLDELDFN